MVDPSDKPQRDTSPSGEISARQNEDGTYEILADDSSVTDDAPESTMSGPKPSRSPRGNDEGEEGPALKSPLTIALLIVTLLVAGATVAYFASGASSGTDEAASVEDDLGFEPYEGDEEGAAEPVADPEAGPDKRASADEDAGSFDEDAGPRERKTEIIVLEEGVDEEPDDDGRNYPRVDKDQLEAIDIGPGAAARLKNGAKLNVDPAKLRNIRFTNSKVPNVLKEKVRERGREAGQEGPDGVNPADSPNGDVDQPGAVEQQPTEMNSAEEPVIE